MRIFVLWLCLASTLARADALEVLGWSPDGRYVALIEHGIYDGSGFPWASLTVLDVVKRKPAAPAMKLDLRGEGATEADAVAQIKKKAEGEQARLKIAQWIAGKTIALSGASAAGGDQL